MILTIKVPVGIRDLEKTSKMQRETKSRSDLLFPCANRRVAIRFLANCHYTEKIAC